MSSCSKSLCIVSSTKKVFQLGSVGQLWCVSRIAFQHCNPLCIWCICCYFLHQNRSLVTCLLRKNGKNVLLSLNSCTFYTKPNLLHGPESSSVKTVNLVKKFATIIAEVMNFHKGFLLAHPVEYRSKDNQTFPTECVCMSLCLLAYHKNNMAKLHQMV